MTYANYRIAEQIGIFGIYGEVSFLFEITSVDKNVSISINNDFNQWKIGILFGLTYWIEHSSERVGLSVQIQDIKFHDVDTNNIVISYLMFKAMQEASEIKNKGHVYLDKNLKSFVFSK